MDTRERKAGGLLLPPRSSPPAREAVLGLAVGLLLPPSSSPPAREAVLGVAVLLPPSSSPPAREAVLGLAVGLLLPPRSSPPARDAVLGLADSSGHFLRLGKSHRCLTLSQVGEMLRKRGYASHSAWTQFLVDLVWQVLRLVLLPKIQMSSELKPGQS